jgi:hypothetical protein
MVSFVTINYNTATLTLQCVRSILSHAALQGCEIIIVDNASVADDREMLEKSLPEGCRLICSRQNLGFGAANMLGANFVGGDYLCFINSDVLLPEDCVTPLTDYLAEHPDIGCITPQQYNKEGQFVRSFNHENGVITEIIPKGLLEKCFPYRYPSRKKLHSEPFTAHHINGAFMLFPADVFWQCGGFDINIFLYGEEYDVAMRLGRIGKRCVVDPTHRFIHLQGQSARKARSKTKREGYISDLYTYQKYHGNFMYLLYKSVILLKLLPHFHDWYAIPAILCGNTLSRSMRHDVNIFVKPEGQ